MLRADQALVAQGLVSSRTRAQALILAGEVHGPAGARIDKPGQPIADGVQLSVRAAMPYVSRGGIKLAHALDNFGIAAKGCICADVGASTGGFTDCLLQRGAERVYAIDVGYNQLDWRLRQDPRVVVHERCNIRTAADDLVPEACQLVVADVSFISLTLVLPRLRTLVAASGHVVVLIKPQFEVGRAAVGKGGIVRDAEAQADAVRKVEQVAVNLGLIVLGCLPSPIHGAKGNREFLLAARAESKGTLQESL